MAFTYRMISSDGREVEFDYPTQLSEEEAQYVADDLAFKEDAREQEEAARARAEAKQKSDDYGVFSTDFAFQDVPLSVMQAVGAAPRIAGQVATAFGSEEFGPEMLKDAEEYQKRIEGMKSEGYQARRLQNAMELAQAEGPMDKFLTSAGQTISPVMLSQELIKMTPELAMTGAAGRLASGLGAGTKGTLGATIGTGAGLQSASVLGDVYQITYDAEIEKGAAPEDAASTALSAARANAAEMFGVSLATMMLPGATALERTLAGVGGGAGKGLVTGAVKGFLGEATQEATEETYGELLKNIQESRYDPTKNIYEGLPEVAGQAGVLGGILGGPAGGIQGMRNAEVESLKKKFEADKKAAQEAEAAAIPTDEDGQMTLPGIPAPQAGPVLPEGGVPVAQPEAPQTAGQQLELPLPEPAPEPQEVPDNWFGNMEPQDRIDAIDAELATFDENPDYETLSPKDKAAAKASLKRARKNAVADRQRLKLQAKEDAPKAAASALSTAEEDLFGVVPDTSREQVDQVGPPAPEVTEVPAAPEFGPTEQPQMDMFQQDALEFRTYDDNQFASDVGVELSQLGEYSRAGKTFNQTRQDLVGLDLTEEADRAKAEEVLERVGNLRKPSKWQTLLTQKLRQRLDATVPEAAKRKDQLTRAELDQQYLEAGQTQDQAAYEQARLDRTLYGRGITEEAPPFELTMVEEVAPELNESQTAAAQNLLQRYSDLMNYEKGYSKTAPIRNRKAVNALETEAKQVLGAKAWGNLKAGLTRRQNAQIKSLRAEREQGPKRGETADMFAAQERADLQAQQRDRVTAEARTKAEQALEEKRVREEEERQRREQEEAQQAYDDAFSKANARSKKTNGAAKVMNGQYVYRGYHIQKAEDGAWNVGEIKDNKPATEFDDAADTLTDAKAIVDNYIEPEVVEDAEPAVRETEVGRRTRRDDQQPAGEPSVAVDDGAVEPEPAPAEEPTAPEPRGVGDTGGTAGRDTGREVRKPTPLKDQVEAVEVTGRSLADIEQDIYTTEGNEQNPYVIEYIKTQTGGMVTVQDFKSVKDALANNEALPTFEPVETVEEAPKAELPKSLRMLRDGIETEAQFVTALDLAIEEGYFSPEERAKIIATFNESDLGQSVAKYRIVKAAKKSSYFQSNPNEISTISQMIANELDSNNPLFHRSDINKGEPLSQKADLEKEFAPLIKKLSKHNKINIVQSANELPEVVPAGTNGVYLNGEVYVIADNTSALEFEEVVAHETIGHLGLETMMGKSGFDSLVRTVNNMKRTNPTMKAIVEKLKRAYTDETGSYNLDETTEAREILAFMAQRRADYLTAGPVRSLYNRVASAVRRFLMGLGFTNKGQRLIDQLVYEAAMHTLGGKHATQKNRRFFKTGSEAQDLMQRAWDLNFRGYNLRDAARYLDDVHSGRIQPQTRSMEQLDKDIDLDPYEQAVYSRKPIDPETVDPKYRDFIPEAKEPARWYKDMSIASGWTGLKNIRNKLRIGLFDQAATFEDKIMNEYNNAVQNADGVINPMVSYVQALKHSALAHQFMRTGVLRLKKNGLWDTLNEDNSRSVSLTDVYEKIAEMGKRIGSVETARKLAGDVYVARREIELHENNLKDIAAGRKPGYTFLIADSTAANGSRPMTQGEEDAHIAAAKKLVNEHFNGEIEEAFNMYNQWREALLQVGVDSGYISESKMQEWKDALAYVPFYRVANEMSNNQEIAVGSGLMNLQRMKKLKGSVKEINDPLDNMEKLGYWFIASAIKNHGAKELARGIREYQGVHSEYDFVEQIPKSLREYAVSYTDDGKEKYLVPNDPLDAHAWKGMEQVSFDVLAPFSKGAEWLRKGITLSPDFIISQIEQDTVRAYAFSGIKSPSKAAAKVLPSFIKIRKDLAEGGLGAEQINRFGIMGMYDISPEKTKEFVEQSISTEKFGWKDRPMSAAFRAGERNAEASDLAPRLAVFEETVNQGGSEVEAFWRSSEIINFSRRGNSSAAVVARQVVPFMNAYMQGMRVLAKAMTGRGLSQKQRAAAFKQFWWTGLKISALSTMYAMAMADDDDYAKEPAHVRSRFLVEPETNLKFALPADVAFLFKHIPETIVMSAMRDDMDGRKVRSELFAAAGNAFLGPNVTPQLIKPILENATNYSFFRDAPIVGVSMKNRILSEQVTESTSQLARLFSYGDYGFSPLMIDNLIKGMLGTSGAYLLFATDVIAEQTFGIERTAREAADIPILKSFVGREYPTGYKTDFYNMRNDVQKLVGTVNLMKREGRGEELAELMSNEDNRRLLGLQKAVNRVNKTINKSNQKIKKIQASNMTSERKKELIDAERERQAALSDQISRMRLAREK
jgi:hypothetical protein